MYSVPLRAVHVVGSHQWQEEARGLCDWLKTNDLTLLRVEQGEAAQPPC